MITRFFKHKTIRQTLSVLLIVVSCFVVPVFAAGSDTGIISGIQEKLNGLISLLSWLWVVFAILAGKLMTNDWVYGSVLHLDSYLWKIWNIMKNFANFALVALLLGTIIKSLVGKGDLKIKSLLTKTLLAGVLIQMSWFLMGALIDISTIAVSAVGAFPQSFIAGDSGIRTQMLSEIQKKMQNQTYKINLKEVAGEKQITQIPNTDSPSSFTDDDALASIMPNDNSISGPLIFLGMSAFRFQEYMNVNTNDGKDLAISFSLKAIILVFYTLGLALLFIANLMRIAFLRVYIIGSPFIILIKVFQDDKAGSKGLAKLFNFSGAINMIFKPVLFIAALSLSLILIVSMQKIMSGTQLNEVNGVQMQSSGTINQISIAGLSSISINNGDTFSDVTNTSKNIFADMIIFFLTIFLVWSLVKFSLSSGGDGPIENVMKGATGWLEGLAMTTPIAPVMGGASIKSLMAAKQQNTANMAKGFGMTTQGNFNIAENEFQNKINGMLNLQPAWTDMDYKAFNKIVRAGGSLEDFFATARDLGQKKEGGVSLADPEFLKSVNYLYTEYKNEGRAEFFVKAGFTGVNSANTLEELLKNKATSPTKNGRTNARIMHELLGGAEGTKNKSIDPGYEELMRNKYFDWKE